MNHKASCELGPFWASAGLSLDGHKSFHIGGDFEITYLMLCRISRQRIPTGCVPEVGCPSAVRSQQWYEKGKGYVHFYPL